MVDPVEQIGQYGGTISSYKDSGHGSDYDRLMGYEGLVKFGPQTDFATVLPNIAYDWEVIDDKEFIMYLREGLRWSDGKSFTTGDILFFWEKHSLNEEIGAISNNYRHLGEPMTVEAIDDYTIKFSFSNPHGLFLYKLAEATVEPFLPEHYLKQFHIDYYDDPTELEEMTKKAGFDNWYQLYAHHSSWKDNPDIPTMNAWQMTNWRGPNMVRSAERNPYYFKVDTEGNQLPYIDSMRIQILESTEVAVTQTLVGQYNWTTRYINTLENKSLFADAMERGTLDARFTKQLWTDKTAATIQFNLVHPDPGYREIIGNPEFRKAISHSLNREDMIQTLFWGTTTARQTAPLPESAFAHEEYANAYLEFDRDKANKMLDEIGLDQRDRNGWRLLPDGRRFDLIFQNTEDYVDIAEMIVTDMQAVGINVQIRALSLSAYRNTARANEHDMAMRHGTGGMEVLQRPNFVLPISSWSMYGIPWRNWINSGGDMGEEPPEDMKQIIELFQHGVASTTDLAKQKEYMRKIYDIHKENLYVIGICDKPQGYSVVANSLRNVPEWWWDSWVVPHAVSTRPFQFYLED